MAVVRCSECGAVVTARRDAQSIEATYGSDFRSKCKSLPEPLAADFVSSAAECPEMDRALRRAAFRVRVEKSAS
jgi:hypothetical protein